MRNALAVYIREVRSYFVSPIFYILAFVFMVVIGNIFKDSFFAFANETMRSLRMAQNYKAPIPMLSVTMVARQMFSYINFLFLLIVPLLTMRLYAEEKKNGTMELLMTSPITTVQVLMGKFFSALTIYTLMLALTITFNIIMMVESGGKLDWGTVWSSYLGSILLGGAIISLGLFFQFAHRKPDRRRRDDHRDHHGILAPHTDIEIPRSPARRHRALSFLFRPHRLLYHGIRIGEAYRIFHIGDSVRSVPDRHHC